MCLACDWPNDNLPVSQTTQQMERLANHRQDTCLRLVISAVTTKRAQQGKELYHGRGFYCGGRKQQP